MSADKGVDKAVYRVADAKSGKSADARSAESEPNMLDRLLSLLPGSDRNTKDDETKLADSEPVRDGDILRFSAEGTDETDEYTIRQRITWDWVADYEQGVADFDWKAQRRTSAGGEWTTISAYDGSWPNTVYDQYYGVGVNGTLAELSGDRKQTHGLLIDKPGDGLPTAMAWKAPESGTVMLSLKTFADKIAEPYLRQNADNAGKKVTLSLMRNDETLCSADDLSVYQKSSEQFAQCLAEHGSIDVQEGDWIRIVADAETGVKAPSLHISPVITYEDKAPAAPKQNVRYDVSYAATDGVVGTQSASPPRSPRTAARPTRRTASRSPSRTAAMRARPRPSSTRPPAPSPSRPPPDSTARPSPAPSSSRTRTVRATRRPSRSVSRNRTRSVSTCCTRPCAATPART